MAKEKWTILDSCQHKAIHWAYDVLLWLHDKLIHYACERDLWRTPEQRAREQPSE